ncbi:MAG: hypothetical protein GX417_07185 [Clostridiales bacterium]|nr:hypothetical protein [Clostridiales bacterium]
MATKIADARQDENGKARGGQAGDQSGKEILVHDWYLRDGGWDVYLECTDEGMALEASNNMIRMANDNSFGYDQDQRWTAEDAILAAGGNIEAAAASETDCSAAVLTSYRLTGLKVARGYTGNLESLLLATGKFVAHREAKYLASGNYAKIGGLYLTAGKHVAMVVTNGSKAETSESASGGEAEEINAGVPYVLVVGGSVYVREGGSTAFDWITTVHRDDKLPYLGKDAATGWYQVVTDRGIGFISCKTKLTRLVTK